MSSVVIVYEEHRRASGDFLSDRGPYLTKQRYWLGQKTGHTEHGALPEQKGRPGTQGGRRHTEKSEVLFEADVLNLLVAGRH